MTLIIHKNGQVYSDSKIVILGSTNVEMAYHGKKLHREADLVWAYTGIDDGDDTINRMIDSFRAHYIGDEALRRRIIEGCVADTDQTNATYIVCRPDGCWVANSRQRWVRMPDGIPVAFGWDQLSAYVLLQLGLEPDVIIRELSELAAGIGGPIQHEDVTVGLGPVMKNVSEKYEVCDEER